MPGAQRLTIQVWLAPRDPASAARFAMAVSTPGNPLFHHFLRPDAYTRRFGGTTAEASAVTSWLRGAGFGGVAAREQRSYVRATAPVSVIDAALGVRLRYYRATSQINAGPYRLRGNDRAVRVPAAVAPGVLAVTGLDNAAPELPQLAREPPSTPRFPAPTTTASTGSATCRASSAPPRSRPRSAATPPRRSAGRTALTGPTTDAARPSRWSSSA